MKRVSTLFGFSYRHPYFTGVLVFLLFLLMTQSYAYLELSNRKKDEDIRLKESMNNAVMRLRQHLSQGMSATRTLHFLISQYGVPGNFEEVGQKLLEANPGIQAVEVVEKGLITHVFPLDENREALGYDIMKDSNTLKEAERAIERKQLYFAGPLKLKQGGVGVVGRLPIFYQDTFYGFSAVIIHLDTLLTRAGIYPSLDPEIQFQLSKINPNSGEREYFVKKADTGFSEGLSETFLLQDGEWTLSAGIQRKYSGALQQFTLIGFLFSILTAIFTVYMLLQPKRLNQMVEEKVRTLNEISWMQSHVIRVPVANLKAAVDLFKHSESEAEKKELFLLIEKLSADIDQLIIEINEKSDGKENE